MSHSNDPVRLDDRTVTASAGARVELVSAAPVVLAALAWGVCSTAAAAATFMVVNTNDVGAGSLEQAILDANANPGLDRIEFDIPGAGPHTIVVPAGFGLSPVTEAVHIDGYSQPGARQADATQSADIRIALDGSALNFVGSALTFYGTDSKVRGLAFHSSVGGGLVILGDGHAVEGCYFGTDPSGSTALPNAQDGIALGACQRSRGHCARQEKSHLGQWPWNVRDG